MPSSPSSAAGDASSRISATSEADGDPSRANPSAPTGRMLAPLDPKPTRPPAYFDARTATAGHCAAGTIGDRLAVGTISDRLGAAPTGDLSMARLASAGVAVRERDESPSGWRQGLSSRHGTPPGPCPARAPTPSAHASSSTSPPLPVRATAAGAATAAAVRVPSSPPSRSPPARRPDVAAEGAASEEVQSGGSSYSGSRGSASPRSPAAHSPGSPTSSATELATARRRAAAEAASWASAQQRPEDEAAEYVAKSFASAALAAEFGRLRNNMPPPPPEDFIPQAAMEGIFGLGMRIAKGSEHDPSHAACVLQWRSSIDALRLDLATWAAWDEWQPKLRSTAAGVLQSFARRRAEHQRFQVAVREARVRRQMAEKAATTLQLQLSTRKAQATQLVAQRRSVIRIQKHWRGLIGRRRARRLRKRRSDDATFRRGGSSSRDSVAEFAPAAALRHSVAASEGATATAAAAATPSPRRASASLNSPAAGLARSLSFGARSLSFGWRARAARADGAANADGTAEADERGEVIARGERRSKGVQAGEGAQAPCSLAQAALADAPATTTPRRRFLRSNSFDTSRSRRREREPSDAPDLPTPSYDREWQEQLQGRLAIEPEKQVHPIRRAFSFTRSTTRSRVSSVSSGIRSLTSLAGRAPASPRATTPSAGAPQSGAIDLRGHRTEALFDDARPADEHADAI